MFGREIKFSRYFKSKRIIISVLLISSMTVLSVFYMNATSMSPTIADLLMEKGIDYSKLPNERRLEALAKIGFEFGGVYNYTLVKAPGQLGVALDKVMATGAVFEFDPYLKGVGGQVAVGGSKIQMALDDDFFKIRPNDLANSPSDIFHEIGHYYSMTIPAKLGLRCVQCSSLDLAAFYPNKFINEVDQWTLTVRTNPLQKDAYTIHTMFNIFRMQYAAQRSLSMLWNSSTKVEFKTATEVFSTFGPAWSENKGTVALVNGMKILMPDISFVESTENEKIAAVISYLKDMNDAGFAYRKTWERITGNNLLNFIRQRKDLYAGLDKDYFEGFAETSQPGVYENKYNIDLDRTYGESADRGFAINGKDPVDIFSDPENAGMEKRISDLKATGLTEEKIVQETDKIRIELKSTVESVRAIASTPKDQLVVSRAQEGGILVSDSQSNTKIRFKNIDADSFEKLTESEKIKVIRDSIGRAVRTVEGYSVAARDQVGRAVGALVNRGALTPAAADKIVSDLSEIVDGASSGNKAAAGQIAENINMQANLNRPPPPDDPLKLNDRIRFLENAKAVVYQVLNGKQPPASETISEPGVITKTSLAKAISASNKINLYGGAVLVTASAGSVARKLEKAKSETERQTILRDASIELNRSGVAIGAFVATGKTVRWIGAIAGYGEAAGTLVSGAEIVFATFVVAALVDPQVRSNLWYGITNPVKTNGAAFDVVKYDLMDHLPNVASGFWKMLSDGKQQSGAAPDSMDAIMWGLAQKNNVPAENKINNSAPLTGLIMVNPDDFTKSVNNSPSQPVAVNSGTNPSIVGGGPTVSTYVPPTPQAYSVQQPVQPASTDGGASPSARTPTSSGGHVVSGAINSGGASAPAANLAQTQVLNPGITLSDKFYSPCASGVQSMPSPFVSDGKGHSVAYDNGKIVTKVVPMIFDEGKTTRLMVWFADGTGGQYPTEITQIQLINGYAKWNDPNQLVSDDSTAYQISASGKLITVAVPKGTQSYLAKYKKNFSFDLSQTDMIKTIDYALSKPDGNAMCVKSSQTVVNNDCGCGVKSAVNSSICAQVPENLRGGLSASELDKIYSQVIK